MRGSGWTASPWLSISIQAEQNHQQVLGAPGLKLNEHLDAEASAS